MEAIYGFGTCEAGGLVDGSINGSNNFRRSYSIIGLNWGTLSLVTFIFLLSVLLSLLLLVLSLSVKESILFSNDLIFSLKCNIFFF